MSKSSQRVILITGCSSGFGLLMAARLSAQGYRVVATMRDLNKKDELLAELQRRGATLASLLALDVVNKASIKMVISKIMVDYGRIDVLINNAGYGMAGFFEDLTEQEIRHQMEVNFFGAQNVTRAVLPVMRHQKKGKIINISSVAGFSASPCFSAYNASKWALEAFSESLRYELRFFGIDVFLIEPGTYKTKIFYENARRAENFDNPQSPYYAFSRHLKQKVMRYVEKCRKDPEQVAILAEKLIKAKRAPFRNIPDRESRFLFFLRKVLPFGAYSHLIQTACFLDMDKSHGGSL